MKLGEDEWFDRPPFIFESQQQTSGYVPVHGGVHDETVVAAIPRAEENRQKLTFRRRQERCLVHRDLAKIKPALKNLSYCIKPLWIGRDGSAGMGGYLESSPLVLDTVFGSTNRNFGRASARINSETMASENSSNPVNVARCNTRGTSSRGRSCGGQSNLKDTAKS